MVLGEPQTLGILPEAPPAVLDAVFPDDTPGVVAFPAAVSISPEFPVFGFVELHIPGQFDRLVLNLFFYPFK